MSKSYKIPYQEALKESQKKDGQIIELNKQLSDLQIKNDTQTTTHNEKVIALETEKTQAQTKRQEAEDELGKTKEQLRTMELSRFASAFAVQEKEYTEQQDFWYDLSIKATGLLILSILLSIFAPHFLEGAQEWYKEPGFYLLNFIFITLFIYSLKQHAHFGNLKIDYANRKTLAQSYQHIIEDEEEFAEIKLRFLQRASDIFSSKAMLRSSDVTLWEVLLSKFSGNSADK